MIKQCAKEKIPEWVFNTNEKYQVVLSDDIDGLISTNLLNKHGWTTEYFYSFDALYVTDEFLEKEDRYATRVWADIPWVSEDHDEKTFDNHVCVLNRKDHINKLMCNPNFFRGSLITNEDYYSKYGASTALMIWGIYDYPLPSSYDGKMLLLCIDSGFKGFFADESRFRHSFMFSTMYLGVDKLYDFIQFMRVEEFYKFISDHNLSRKIRMNENGYLETGLDLGFLSEALEMEITLPDKHFNKIAEFENHDVRRVCGILDGIRDLGDPITVAFVGKDKVKYSTLKSQVS